MFLKFVEILEEIGINTSFLMSPMFMFFLFQITSIARDSSPKNSIFSQNCPWYTESVTRIFIIFFTANFRCHRLKFPNLAWPLARTTIHMKFATRNFFITAVFCRFWNGLKKIHWEKSKHWVTGRVSGWMVIKTVIRFLFISNMLTSKT